MKLNKTELPKGWEFRALGELLECPPKYGINAAGIEYSNSLPTYLRITDIDDSCNFSPDKIVSVNTSNKDYFLKKGDIVFARTGATVGKNYLYKESDGELVFAGFLIKFTPKLEKLNCSYLSNYCQTQSYWRWVKTTSMRSGQPGINSSEYSSLKIPVPPIGEQERIAEVLSCWDKAIEENLKIIALKEKRKKALMQSLLKGKTKLERHIRQISIKNSKNEIENVLSVTNSNGFISQKNKFDRVIASKDLRNYKIVKKGEFAYNPSRINVGSIDLLGNFNIGVISPIYVVFKTLEDKLSKHYLKHLFKSCIFYNQISRYTQGSVRDNLGFDGLEMIRMNIPSLTEQEKIAEILSVADEGISLHKAKVELLKKQKKYLMQVLLSGKVRLASS